MEKKPLCIAMVPSPGLGHLILNVEFAKQLVLQHPDFHVTLLIPTLGPPLSSSEAILEALPPTIDFTLLPQLLQKLDETVSGEFTEVKIPGINASFLGKDLPESLTAGRSAEVYRLVLQVCKQLHFADGVIVNSFVDLGPGPIKALQEQEVNNHYPGIYPVGPIIQNGSDLGVNGSECLKWLDNQPCKKSVLYVSFGSGGTLSQDQLNELALGLELSGHKFLWVVRVPSKTASAAYFNAKNEDPLHNLPYGFLDRAKEQGLVVPSWAPQIEILKHGSTGGFLTHCGWSSILESIVHGVPMIVWPLFAEQGMNAVILTDELKIALRPERQADQIGVVGRQEIAEVVKRLMEGDEGREVRRRIEDLKEACVVALSENGSCRRTLSSLAHKWRSLSCT